MMVWVKGVVDWLLFIIGIDGDIVDCGGVFVLVGLIGVGKIIIIVKLVVCCVLWYGLNKVVLVMIDGYWIGVYE